MGLKGSISLNAFDTITPCPGDPPDVPGQGVIVTFGPPMYLQEGLWDWNRKSWVWTTGNNSWKWAHCNYYPWL